MHIAIAAAQGSANDPNTWSGTPASLGKALRELGCHVTALGPYGAHSRRAFRYTNAATSYVRRYGKKRWETSHSTQRRVAEGLRRDVRASGADVVLCAGWLPWVEDLRVPVAFYGDATMTQRLNVAPYWSGLSPATQEHTRMYERKAYLGVHPVMASQWAADSVGDLSGQKASVIGFGMNLQPQREPEFRRPIDGVLRVCSVGREWHRKGFDILVDAVRVLNTSGVRAELTLFGVDRRSADCTERWLTCVPSATGEDIAAGLAASHIYAHPARDEPFGISINEAAGHGLPVMASALPAVAERFRESQAHLMAPGGTVAQWAGELATLASDTVRRASLAQEAYALVTSKFTWNACAEQWVELLEGLQR